ncbi:Heavy-metal-associated domain (N-terminus) and membrane-bounded cytochrome biogenesis cycZ-like domain, possible membrane copper tolerance protein [Nitrincola lacisaponensis]|uniref:Heavy-metal-associated domain (N-terminus) and membrane-bounded cytochrome biogenesis cycZ-like domain, possible membrane copper tolerance protein n=1 Tax=Nitrincola lacisaponensis TaxID=267850 RepID=A0A063Y1A2_9GAMM|nr:sulfite exporter TauE/SafE family protein [Nitrincola lacisaponensis]KDE38541.1 Heavy-metal-associated domain (N-terminus) and membrane-bounded cytochrome biogenesis cycZ-like domain, possible membrane copper tolerance protein [Nitrincola lacisaponensis]
MTEPLLFTTALLIGLLGSTHCIGMCGGIAASVGLSTRQNGQSAWLILLGYNLGRIASYTLAGALLGIAGALVATGITGVLLQTLAGLLLIAMGLYVGQWWFGITRLESLGGHLWRHLQPVAARILPVRSPTQAVLLGIVWGWLPCGLVYSTLLWSSASGSWQQSALLMAAFGLGTLPAMFTTGLLARQVQAVMQKRLTRQLAGGVIILFGLYTLPWGRILNLS